MSDTTKEASAGTDIVFANSPLNLIVADANGEAVGVDYLDEFMLHPVYPNPFNPETRITYSLFKDGIVNISIYDIQGQLVDQLVNQTQIMGNYELKWNAKNNPSGLYFIKMIASDFTETQKLMLIK